MKTKKYALLMALAVLGTGSVVFAASSEPAIDFETIGRKGNRIYWDLSWKQREEVEQKVKDYLLKNVDCDKLATIRGDDNYDIWFSGLTYDVLNSKKPDFLMQKYREYQNMSLEQLKREDADLSTKYKLYNHKTSSCLLWSAEKDVLRPILEAKEAESKKAANSASTSHSSNFSFKTEDSPPPPSAKNNGVDTSNLDFSDSRTINKIYRDILYDRNADLNFREKLEQKLKDFSSNKTFDELRRIYKNAYKSEGFSWYTGIVSDLLDSKEDQHLKDLESKCESMDKNALEVALSEAKEKRSKGTGDGAVYYTYGKETDVIEKVLKSKKEKALKEKAAQEEIDAIKEKINKLKNEAKKAEPSPKAEPDPEVDYSWEPSDEGMDEEEPRPMKKSSKRRRPSYQAKKQKRIMEEVEGEEEDLQTQEYSYDEDAEGEDNDEFDKKPNISKEMGKYLVQKIKNKPLSRTIRDLGENGDLDEKDWAALAKYMAQQNLTTFFQQYNKKNAGNVEKFHEDWTSKYRFLNHLIFVSRDYPKVQDKLEDNIATLIRYDSGIAPLGKCLDDCFKIKPFKEIDESLITYEAEFDAEGKFARNEINFKEFSNEMIVVISNKINDLITTKKEQLQEEEEEEEDDKERAREEKKIIDEVKNIMSINLRGSTELINRIKSLAKSEGADYGEFVNILKAMEKKDARKAPVGKKAPARSRSLSPKKELVGKKAPARSRSLSPKKSNRG